MRLSDVAGEPAGSETGLPGRLAGGGGGGGSSGRALADVTYYVTIAPLAEETPLPIPAPEIAPIEELTVDVPPPPEEIDVPAVSPDLALGAGGEGTGEGVGTGSGVGPGTGSGTGGGSGSGTGTGVGAGTGPGSGQGGSIREPEPLAMIWVPDPPRGVRGRTVTIRLQVDDRGEVTGVRLLSSSGDRRYDRQLAERAAEWRFRPARDPEGRAIAYHKDITWEF